MEPRIIQLMPISKDHYSGINFTHPCRIIALALVEQEGIQKMLYVGGNLPEARILTEADFE